MTCLLEIDEVLGYHFEFSENRRVCRAGRRLSGSNTGGARFHRPMIEDSDETGSVPIMLPVQGGFGGQQVEQGVVCR